MLDVCREAVGIQDWTASNISRLAGFVRLDGLARLRHATEEALPGIN